jgi:hypothetical protein
LQVNPTDGPPQVENWPGWDRARALADAVRAGLAGSPPVTWLDATRCLELFDAARRSAKRRRVVPMDYEAMSESGNFKSTMTAVGCGVLLLISILFLAIPAVPWFKYLIPVLLFIFLVLQVLRWVARDELAHAQPDEHKETVS